MQITAKFASVCSSCGSRIWVGARVEWSKGSPARHVSCETSAPVAPSAPSAPATPRAPRAPVSTEPAPHLLLRRCGYSKPETEKEIGRVFRVSRKDRETPGMIVKIVRASRSYLRADDAEDMGDPDDAGWTLRMECREATSEESAPIFASEWDAALAENAVRDEQALARTEKVAKDALIMARKEALKEGKTYSGYMYVRPAQVEVVESLGTVGTGSAACSYWTVRLASGEVVLYEAFGNACVMYASRETVEAAWRALASAMGTDATLAKEWVAQYGEGVAGYEFFDFIANS